MWKNSRYNKNNLDFKKLLKYFGDIGIYLSASLIPMILNLAMNPLVALNMTPRDYAITGYYNSFNTLISPLIVFYMLHYYVKRFYEIDAEERLKLKATIFKGLIFFSGFLSIISFFFILGYVLLFNGNSELPIYPYLLLSVFSLPLTGIYTLMLTDYKMNKDSKSYFRLSVSNGVLAILLVFLFVVILKLGAIGKMLAPFLTNLFLFILCCYLNRKLFKIKFDSQRFRDLLVFCTPLTIAAMLGFFSNGFDRVFLERIGDVTEYGYYIVGFQMAGYLSVFGTAIGATFQPDLFESIVKRNFHKTAKIVGLTLFLTSIVVISFILLAPFLVNILTAGRYILSTKYTQIIALSTITSMMYFSISQITVALGKTKITLYNKILTSVLIVTMFYELITHYQFMGAAWGIVLSFVISFLGNVLLLYIFKTKKNAT